MQRTTQFITEVEELEIAELVELSLLGSYYHLPVYTK